MEQPLDTTTANSLSAVLASFVTGAFGVFIWLMTKGREAKKARADENAEIAESERKSRTDLWTSMQELYKALQQKNDAQASRLLALEDERIKLLERIIRLEVQVHDLEEQTEACRKENAAFRSKLFELTGDSEV